MMRAIWIIFFIVGLIGCGSKDSEKKFQGTSANKNYIDQGMNYLSKGDIKEAIRSFDEAIRQDPSNPENYITLGQVYLRLGNPVRAIDSFSAATRVDPFSGEAYYLLATSNAIDGRMKEAVDSAQKSVEIFMQERNEERFKKSLALLKSLTETVQKATMQEQTPPPPTVQ